jgi:hypothetical protein
MGHPVGGGWAGVVNREKLQEWRYREGTVGDIKRAGVSHFRASG